MCLSSFWCVQIRLLLLVGLVWSYGFPSLLEAAEITLPLTVRYDVLTQELRKQLYTRADGVARIWYENACRYLLLDRPQFSSDGARVRFVTHGTGAAGTEVLDQCLAPLSWRGFLEAWATPTVTADWRLHLQIADTKLYDEEWKQGLLTGPIWEAAEHFLLADLKEFTFNLAPPQEEILSVARVSVAASAAAQIEAVLNSAVAKAITVTSRGIEVQVGFTVPDTMLQAPSPPSQPEEPLSPAELEAVQQALERWDAFLVFVVKGIGGDFADKQLREDLIELLLTSRYALLPVLSGEINRGQGDPVRRIFVETWTSLREILRHAEQRGVENDKIARYATFISAGDALLALEQAAPGLGIEISADGLRRLARLLRPDVQEDPLAVSLTVDPTLRSFFALPLEDTTLPPLPQEEPSSWLPFFGWGTPAYAAREEPAGLETMRQRLVGWVPESEELPTYRGMIATLLQLTTERVQQEATLENTVAAIYRTLTLATALKESCWRQFEKQGEKVRPLTSAYGSIGLMQVNPQVWRGFYDLGQLRQNPVYNAHAGAQILSRYFSKYGVEEGKRTGNPRNSARATYAVYNAGPKAADRYRSAASTEREKRVDQQFWKIYQGFEAHREVDLESCTCG
jgi:hypothetical protein